jgi:15-cis-phytoene synthase
MLGRGPAANMTDSVATSYQHCETIARARAKNFYYSFLVLPKHKRLAMCAVYAFMRECDDLSDETGASADKLQIWRQDMEAALEGNFAAHPIWPAFAHTVQSFQIPRQYLHEMIDGVGSDLVFRQPQTFEELYAYCYRVAGVVGLTITHIFGFQSPRDLEMAEQCGIAFQITNILRDVREDAGLGRTYLPQDLMAKHGVKLADLQGDSVAAPVRSLLQDLGQRARNYYSASRPLIQSVHRDSRSSLWALMEVYTRLFRRIEASNFEVLRQRHRVPTWEKLSLVARAMLS